MSRPDHDGVVDRVLGHGRRAGPQGRVGLARSMAGRRRWIRAGGQRAARRGWRRAARAGRCPETPATPTSSPGPDVEGGCSRRGVAVGCVDRRRPSTRAPARSAAPTRSAGSGGGTAPTMSAISSSSVWSAGDAPTRTLRPRRSTVRRSATARVSRSLWVMSTMPRPSLRSRSIVASRASTSCGARALVGSSRITTRASQQQHPEDLDELALGDREVAHGTVGVDGAGRALGRLDEHRARSAWRRSRPPPMASCTFSSTVRAGTRRRSWKTMPMPAARAAGR